VLEVPHQRRGIEEVDGGDAQPGMGDRSHALLEYQRWAVNSGTFLRCVGAADLVSWKSQLRAG
jgi:hypothetical protein